MGATSKMTPSAMHVALKAVSVAQDEALAEWKAYAASVPRRMNVAQRERAAYLRGRLAGLHQAQTEFEMRAPIEFYGSGDQRATD